MYLSKLILNPRSRQVQKELGNLYELHRSLMRSFPDNTSREKAALLYRLDTRREAFSTGISILAQSKIKPQWDFLAERNGYLLSSPPAVKEIHADASLKGAFRFYLRANPTRRNKETRKLIPLHQEQQLGDWLLKNGKQYGFSFERENLLVRKMPPVAMFKREEGKTLHIQLQAVDFSGILQVTDSEKFVSGWQFGIGRGRSFGCGLLSLARI